MSTMNCTVCPLIWPVGMKCPCASAVSTMRTGPTDAGAAPRPTLTGESPTRRVWRWPSTDTVADSPCVPSNVTPWCDCPGLRKRGAEPSMVTKALLPAIPESATDWACAPATDRARKPIKRRSLRIACLFQGAVGPALPTHQRRPIGVTPQAARGESISRENCQTTAAGLSARCESAPSPLASRRAWRP